MATVGALLSAAPAFARDITYQTSNGSRVTVMPLEEIGSCAEAEQMQATIDRSRYRTGPPDSLTDPNDIALARYEDGVAQIIYRLCPAQRGYPERIQGYSQPIGRQ